MEKRQPTPTRTLSYPEYTQLLNRGSHIFVEYNSRTESVLALLNTLPESLRNQFSVLITDTATIIRTEQNNHIGIPISYYTPAIDLTIAFMQLFAPQDKRGLFESTVMNALLRQTYHKIFDTKSYTHNKLINPKKINVSGQGVHGEGMLETIHRSYRFSEHLNPLLYSWLTMKRFKDGFTLHPAASDPWLRFRIEAYSFFPKENPLLDDGLHGQVDIMFYLCLDWFQQFSQRQGYQLSTQPPNLENWQELRGYITTEALNCAAMNLTKTTNGIIAPLHIGQDSPFIFNNSNQFELDSSFLNSIKRYLQYHNSSFHEKSSSYFVNAHSSSTSSGCPLGHKAPPDARLSHHPFDVTYVPESLRNQLATTKNPIEQGVNCFLELADYYAKRLYQSS